MRGFALRKTWKPGPRARIGGAGSESYRNRLAAPAAVRRRRVFRWPRRPHRPFSNESDRRPGLSAGGSNRFSRHLESRAFGAGGRTGTRFANRRTPGFRHPTAGRAEPGSVQRRQRHAEYREALNPRGGPVRDSSRPNEAFNRNPPPGFMVSAARCGGSG
jgi:hypothetical protein